MADSGSQQTVKYHRRLDRTPEKYFEKLPDSEKKLISAVRNALEGCRKKVGTLKDDLAEKDKTIETERRLRKEAEDYLKAYVDPYTSPLVNSELRMRLPRAGKVDPFQDINAYIASNVTELAEDAIVENQEPKTYMRGSCKTEMQYKQKVRRSLNFYPSKSQADSQYDIGGDTEEDSSTDEELPAFQEAHTGYKKQTSRQRTHSVPPDMSCFPVVWPAGYPAVPYLPQSHRPASCPLYYSLTPWSSASSLGMFPSFPVSPRGPQDVTSLQKSHPSQQGLGVVQSSGNQKPSSEGKSDEASSDIIKHENTTSTLQEAPQRVSKVPVLESSGPREGTSQEKHNDSSSSMSSHLGLPSSVTVPGGSSALWHPMFSVPSFPVGFDGAAGGDVSSQQTVFLHDEICRLQEQNRQLKENLGLKSQELESLKLHISLNSSTDGTLDASSVNKLTEFMAEVKVAQEKQEKVTQARIHQADEDRDKAVMELDRALIHACVTDRYKAAIPQLDDSSSDTDESDFEHLLRKKRGGSKHCTSSRGSSKERRLSECSEGPKSHDDGTAMLKELENRCQREREIYLEEMQVLLEQRDKALQEVRCLKEKQQLRQLQVPTQREQMLLAKIAVLQKERDSANEAIRRLRDEQVDYGLLSSLHKALFVDSTVNHLSAAHSTEKTYPAKEKNHGDKKKDSDDKEKDTDDKEKEESKINEKEDNQLLEQLRQADHERALLQDRCQELERQHRREREERNKLERLTGVLQKKLIALAKSSKHGEQEENTSCSK